MKTQHIILFLLMMAAAIACLSGVVALFCNAFQAAKRQFQRASLASDDNVIQWTEGGALTLLAQKTMGKVSQIITGLTVKVSAHNILPMVDPVDGTAFEEGEDIARCACGTNYHMHSWQWLMEKAEGRCVNCKRLTLPQRMPA